MKLDKKNLKELLLSVKNKLKNSVVTSSISKFLEDKRVLEDFKLAINNYLNSFDDVNINLNTEKYNSLANHLQVFLDRTNTPSSINVYHIDIIDCMNFTIDSINSKYYFEHEGTEIPHEENMSPFSYDNNYIDNTSEKIINVNEEKKDNRKSNPNWDRVELILTLNLYNKTFPALPDSNHEEIVNLSILLIDYHKLIGNQITSTLRNTNGIFMKLKNFESLDNRSKNQGLKSASKLDKEIWSEFFNNQDKLNKLVIWIRSLIDEKNVEDLKLINDDDFIEDKLEEFYSIKTSTKSSSIAKGITDKIFDKHQNPVLNISSVTKVFSKYIINYNAEYTSTIIGIFAKWGRGKTFFYELLKKEIEKEESKNIYFTEFQPWKYQKQESAWAYLYEKILEDYLDTRKEYDNYFLNFFNNLKIVKKIKLNISRIGKFELIKNTIILVVLLILALIPKIEQIEFLANWLYQIHILGLGGLLIFVYKVYKFYLGNKDTIIKLIDKYGKTKDYSSYLGFQNEIEKELKHLICTYIKDKEQLILFIDDLDRCNEKMIIDIMDSLRLVLEDEDINKKLTIITAVDERILLKSIKHKYFDEESIGDESDKISPREYIEKFFLIALKLNHLSDKDKIELVNEYTDVFNIEHILYQTTDGMPKVIKKIQVGKKLNEYDKSFIKSEENVREFVNEKTIEVKDDYVDIKNEEKKLDENEEKELEILNELEIEFIRKQVLKLDIDTPRKINMMVQRYLLFKNFVFEEFGYEKELDYKLLISLIFTVLDDQKLKELIKKYLDNSNEKIEFEINGNKFIENRNDYIVLLKYAEMVSPF